MFNTIFIVTPSDLFGIALVVIVSVIGIPIIIYKRMTRSKRKNKKDLDEWLKNN